MKNWIAKGIRVITIPPILVSVMLLILYDTYGKAFTSLPMLLWAMFSLAFMPMFAYPLASIKYKLQKHKLYAPTLRDMQRHLAFLLSLIGYLIGFVVGWLGHSSAMMMGLFTGYLVGVVLLTVLNKAFHTKASGHACSCVMAYLFLWRWLGTGVLFICIPLYAGEFWASVFLKRHTSKEFILGSGAAAVAFLIQWLCFQ